MTNLTRLCSILVCSDSELTTTKKFLEEARKIVSDYKGLIYQNNQGPVFVFESPTDAVLFALKLKAQVPKLRGFIHSAEANLTSTEAHGSAINFAFACLTHIAANELVISRSTSLIINNAEIPAYTKHDYIVAGYPGTHTFHYLELQTEEESSTKRSEANSASLFSKPATFDVRVLAGLLDLGTLLVVYMAITFVSRAPIDFSRLMNTVIIEIEEMQLTGYEPEKIKFALSGEVVRPRSHFSTAEYIFPGPEGIWNALIRYGKSKEFPGPSAEFELGNNHVGNILLPPRTKRFAIKSILESIYLKRGATIKLKMNSPYPTELDALIFIPATTTNLKGTRHLWRQRFGYLYSMLGIDWILNQTGRAARVFGLNAIFGGTSFLTLLTWTPGCLLMGIRVVDKNGAALGLKKAALRSIVAPISFLLGATLVPILDESGSTFYDNWLETRVVKL